MEIKVLFFGRLREIAGCSADTLSLAAPVSLGQVFEHYAAKWPALQEMRSSIVMARNQEFAPPNTRLEDQDEVALLPPVSGGTGALTREPIDSAALARQTASPHDGAVIVFEGIVRDNTKGRKTTHLEYEGYEPMALKIIQELIDRLLQDHAVSRVSIVHRLGRMEIGEASVSIVVAAPHRGPAYAASRDAIDTLKRTVPIWKKEFFEDGEVWVEGEWDSRLSAHSV